MTKYPPGLEDYIRSIAGGRSNEETARMVREHFGIEFTASQCKSYKHNRHILSGLTGHFQKGNVPVNKGKKMSEYCSPDVIEKIKGTQFRKGHKPHNTDKVGDIVKTSDGYLKKKVAEPKKWKFLHRLVWEETYGEIPKGMIVIFKDGNALNCEPENLALVTRAEHAMLNHNSRRSTHPEITECQIAVVRMQRKVREKRK